MQGNFILTDDQLRKICLVNGSVSLVLNTLCIFLTFKLSHIFVSNIYAVTIFLQSFYFIQNILFNLTFVPFLYAGYGGGYCIGFLCKDHVVPFWALYCVYVFLTTSISGLFVLLIFFRHQNLMPAESKVKLSSTAANVFAVLSMIVVNIIPARYAFNSVPLDSQQRESILMQLCPTCDWIESRRNFAVLNAYFARVDGLIVVATVVVYGCFTFLCAGHIMHLMLLHRRKSSIRGITVTHRQTRQSLVQVFVFGAFLAVPILMFMSVPLLGVSDGILVPTIILLSLSSLVHSATLLASTPPFRKLIRKALLTRSGTTHEIATAMTLK